MKVLTILGTRPEAIKLAPVIIELGKQASIDSRLCVTAQHRGMLDQVLNLFDIAPDIDLNLMQPGQTLPELTAKVCVEIDKVLAQESPDLVIVQGDTTTVMASALSAFYRGIRVGHVEAGLRSGDIRSPFPEEMNRRVVSMLGNLHFAPTERASELLLREGIPSSCVFLTGNPVIDALRIITSKDIPGLAGELLRSSGLRGSADDPALILVTAHRRENFGKKFESICRGLRRIAERNQDVVILYPVHLNPNVQEPVHRILGNTERIILTEPVAYDVIAHLMDAAHLVLTDSGGIQEEAPSMGKPVLVMRTETERPEGVEAGTAKLVGPCEDRIVSEIELLLRDRDTYERMARAVNPYGDGHAAKRIVEAILAQS